MGAIGAAINVGDPGLDTGYLICISGTLIRNKRTKEIIKPHNGVYGRHEYEFVDVKDLTDLDKLIYDID